MRDVRKAERGKNRGFTLVELVVVITVLGMLMAILIPQLLGYIDESKLRAQYAAGEGCRVAAQAKLDALQYQGTMSDYNSAGEISQNSDAGKIDFWHPAFADPVLDMSGQKVRNLLVAMGDCSYYLENRMDTTPAYRVYYVMYQQDEESPVVFYDGSEWGTECPAAMSVLQDHAQINGDAVFLQYFWLKCESDDTATVFQRLIKGND